MAEPAASNSANANRKTFVASYSGGKDSVHAVYRAMQLGMAPLSLLTTYNVDKQRSWFHGIPASLLRSVSSSLNIPIQLIRTGGQDYAANLEQALAAQKAAGAAVCVFGDIDLDEHRAWCTERCLNVGLEPFFPLWQQDRRQLVYDFIDYGFTAHITVIDTARMDTRHLGKVLTRATADAISAEGADICGENGEYHTFVSAGPLFRHPVPFHFGAALRLENYAVLPLIP